jgi:hypothetical protein
LIRLERRSEVLSRQQGEIGDGNHPQSRITIHGAEGEKLLDIGIAHPRLFAEDAQRGIVERFIDTDETARQRPFAARRMLVALVQQRDGRSMKDRHQHEIYGDRGAIVERRIIARQELRFAIGHRSTLYAICALLMCNARICQASMKRWRLRCADL